MSNEPKNEFFKIPFNTYDIFGYLIPGSFFFIGSYIFEFFLVNTNEQKIIAPVYHLINHIILNTGNNIIIGSIFLIIIIILAYVTGHILASISSHILDRVLIEKGHGYPYQVLLGLESDYYRVGKISAAIRGFFFWFNIYLITQYIGFSTKNLFYTNFANYLICVLLIYLAISSFLYLILRSKPIIPITHINFGFLTFLNKAYDGFLKYVVSGPYDLILKTFSIFSGSRESFDPIFQEKYKRYFESNFNYDINTAKTNNYWLSFLYSSEKSKFASSLISNWLFLYSFARNISASLFILFIYSFILLMQNKNIHTDFATISLPICFFIGHLVMLSRYYYLYKNYYTKFIFRSFIYLNEIEQNNSQRNDSSE